jgi:hypothetical protein
MKASKDNHEIRNPEWYAADFITQLHLDSKPDQRCEWSCLLWSKDHWAAEAKRAQINMQQTKERARSSEQTTPQALFPESQFLNTVAQAYSKLFGRTDQFCDTKDFPKCPYMSQRQDLLETGSLASVFVTILHKATLYAMLDQHPIDSGLMDDEYEDVYGINLTSFQDLERSLTDGRFKTLYEAVLKRAKELAGISTQGKV